MNACYRDGVLILGAKYADPTTAPHCDKTAIARRDRAILWVRRLHGDVESWVCSIPSGTINVDNFQLFLSTLRAGLQANSPNSFLLYYETIDGQLKTNNVNSYFNKLCAHQRFFQNGSTVVSDGMFCNYGWDAAMIASSASWQSSSPARSILQGVQVPQTASELAALEHAEVRALILGAHLFFVLSLLHKVSSQYA